MVRTRTGFAILIGLALLMAAAVIVRATWVSRRLMDSRWYEQKAAAMVVAELGVVCFWWPLVRRQERPMRPRRALLVRIAGGIYAFVLGFYAIPAGLRLSAHSGVLIIPSLGMIVLLVGRPRLATMWLVGGIAGPGLAILVLYLLEAADCLTLYSRITVGNMLLLSSFPLGMLLGLALAAAFLGPVVPSES